MENTEESRFPFAHQMRQKAIESPNNTTMQQIKKEIMKKSAIGEYSARFNFGLSQPEKIYLEERGYTIETDQGDYMNAGWTTVSWLKEK